MSPRVSPGIGIAVFKSLIYTMNGITPTGFPSSTSTANTTACVAKSPRSPGHHFIALSSGVLIINSYFSTSKEAVVLSPAISDPCPISVCA